MIELQNEHVEFKLIENYIKNGNSNNVINIKKNISKIFAIERKGEAEHILSFAN